MNENITPDTSDMEKAPRRMSYLLRLWCVDEMGRANWHASLELPENGQRIGFATLEQLFVYLLDMCEGRTDI